LSFEKFIFHLEYLYISFRSQVIFDKIIRASQSKKIVLKKLDIFLFVFKVVNVYEKVFKSMIKYP